MISRFVFPARTASALRQDLLNFAPNEAGAVLLGRQSGSRSLIIDEYHVAPPSACVVQKADRLEIAPAFLAPLLKRARAERRSVILAHTHPGTYWPQFSLADDRGEREMLPALFARAPDGPHGALVLGEQGHSARLQFADGATRPVPEVVEVGREVSRYRENSSGYDLAPSEDRNVRALGEEGQRTLRELRIAVVGAGGTGSLIIEQLAHLGVGSLILIDDDELEASNLNRVVGVGPRDVGSFKVYAAAEMVARISCGRTSVEAIVGNVLDEFAGGKLLETDFIFGCTDTHGSRALINQIAYQHLVPAIDLGIRIDASEGKIRAMAGRVQMLAPELPCLQCGSLLDPLQVRRDLQSEADRAADPYIVGEAVPQPSVITLNGVVASLATTMLLAAVTRFPMRSRHQNYMIGEGVVRSVGGSPDPSCIVCSGVGAFASGNSWPLFWRRS